MKYLNTISDLVMIGLLWAVAIQVNIEVPGFPAYFAGLFWAAGSNLFVYDILIRHNIK
jgi:hypothetical protein